jgi:hypothetical protein
MSKQNKKPVQISSSIIPLTAGGTLKISSQISVLIITKLPTLETK